jgi:hypothetical protein
VKKIDFQHCARCLAFCVFAWLGGASFSARAKPAGLVSRSTVGPFLNGALPEVAPSISGNWSAVVAFPLKELIAGR